MQETVTTSRIEAQEKAYATYKVLSVNSRNDALQVLKCLAPIYRVLPDERKTADLKKLRAEMYEALKQGQAPAKELMLAYVDMIIE